MDTTEAGSHSGRGSPPVFAGHTEVRSATPVVEGPIQWIYERAVVKKLLAFSTFFQWAWIPSGNWGLIDFHDRYTEYIVSDDRLTPDGPALGVVSRHVKHLPVIGSVTDVWWWGEDFGLGIIDRLNSNASIKLPMMAGPDLHIRTAHGLWIMSTQTRKIATGELFNCYERIATHLLSHGQ